MKNDVIRVIMFTIGVTGLACGLAYHYEVEYVRYQLQTNCIMDKVHSGVPRSKIIVTDDGCKVSELP